MVTNRSDPQILLEVLEKVYAKRKIAPNPELKQLSDRLRDASHDFRDDSNQVQHLLDDSNQVHHLLASQFCGRDDSFDVEHYPGDEVKPALVLECAPPVAEIRWVDDVEQRFAGPDDDPGTVAGLSWGTGVLVDTDLMLTAGHLFDPVDGGVKRPTHNSVSLSRCDLAKLMCARFNFQVDKGGTRRPFTTVPIVELVEHQQIPDVIDFALVRLGTGP